MQELLWDIYSLLCKTHLVVAANISSSIISDISTHDVEQILTTIETSLVFHLLPLNEYQYHINVFFTLSLSGNQCQCHLYVNVTHHPITRTSSPPSCGSLPESMSMSPLCQCHGFIMWLCSWQPQWFGETWGLWGFGETHGVCLHLQQGSWGRTSEAYWSILPKGYIFHLSG